ncbi:MAG: hypothetical protein M0P33_00780, partial [Massilibacteroides sp.]|nr:hypothetical protein [Massilibacteroides sp.]
LSLAKIGKKFHPTSTFLDIELGKLYLLLDCPERAYKYIKKKDILDLLDPDIFLIKLFYFIKLEKLQDLFELLDNIKKENLNLFETLLKYIVENDKISDYFSSLTIKRKFFSYCVKALPDNLVITKKIIEIEEENSTKALTICDNFIKRNKKINDFDFLVLADSLYIKNNKFDEANELTNQLNLILLNNDIKYFDTLSILTYHYIMVFLAINENNFEKAKSLYEEAMNYTTRIYSFKEYCVRACDKLEQHQTIYNLLFVDIEEFEKLEVRLILYYIHACYELNKKNEYKELIALLNKSKRLHRYFNKAEMGFAKKTILLNTNTISLSESTFPDNFTFMVQWDEDEDEDQDEQTSFNTIKKFINIFLNSPKLDNIMERFEKKHKGIFDKLNALDKDALIDVTSLFRKDNDNKFEDKDIIDIADLFKKEDYDKTETDRELLNKPKDNTIKLLSEDLFKNTSDKN